jgi:hypothetical protein
MIHSGTPLESKHPLGEQRHPIKHKSGADSGLIGLQDRVMRCRNPLAHNSETLSHAVALDV